ncbi:MULTISPECIES: hypothetical protein [Citricoccus]|uniref:hypothetical protein n=1 Tax=Citricoccus TaxID=169133 RepID=UPI000255F136|nr:hypothetical protein [Citricoccus sp. CH26A]
MQQSLTLVEHLLWFANIHGSPRPAATIRQALTTAQYVYGHPGAPALSLLEKIEIATTHTH